jgi:hypothetical protein
MINYGYINDSIEYYEKCGFKRVEAPWTVSEYVDSLTRPENIVPYQLNNGRCLVASGEQSFLDLYLKEFLPLGQFQTVTPCFRRDARDAMHGKYFIKNELIKTDIVNDDALDSVVEIAAKFFEKYVDVITWKGTSEGYDLMYNGYELGSYGIRESEFLTWIYGTGCAEPRLSRVINLKERY